MSWKFGRILGKRSWFICFALLLKVLASDDLQAATLINLGWSPNAESDLAGYRLQYGTSPGVYSTSIAVGSVTTYSISGLDQNTTYYFVLEAYDLSGNVSPPSNEVSGRPSVVAGTPPTVSSAIEVATGSIYILQSGRHAVRITGTSFQRDAVVGLGAGITAGPTSISGTTQLSATVDVGASAALGGRTLTVTNSDGGSGSKASALVVVKTTDINRDCRIDGTDLNALARAWNSTASSPNYNAAADLDGDGSVDGDDLAIFVKFFGHPLAVCP